MGWPQQKIALFRYLAACVFFVVFAVSVAWALSAPPLPLSLPRFSLIDQSGTSITEKDVAGKPMLIFFGFAGCSSICPITLARMSETLSLLEQKAPITGLFITLDGAEDNPKAIAQYLAPFHKNIKGVTGSYEELKRLYATFKIYASSQKIDGQMDHSALLYLTDASGRILTSFTAQTPARELADDILSTLQHAGAQS